MPFSRIAAAIALFAFATIATSAPPQQGEKKDTKKAKADPDDPFAPGAGAAKVPGKDAPGAAAPGGIVPIDGNATVTFGPAGCPVAVVGDHVWDLKTNAPGQKLDGVPTERGHRALSADGKMLAAASKSPNQTDTTVGVWDTTTGQRVLNVPGVKEVYVDFVALARNKYLLLGGRHNRTIDVWDIETGKLTKKLTVPDRRVEPDGKIAFTPDGKFFAGIAHDRIVVTDTATNKMIAVMAPPGPGFVPDAPGGVQPKRNPTDAIFVYAWARGMAFSPDGSELALFSTHPSPRLLVWSIKGGLLIDEPVPLPRTVSHRSTLEWQQDGSGWLVNGYLIDRASKKVVLSVRVPFAAEVLPHIVDMDRIMGSFGEDRGRLQTVTIPNDKIAAALKLMKDKGPSFVAPGKPICIELELAGLRGDEAETRRILSDALVRRLARDGIPVQPNQSAVLLLKLQEKAGEALPIFERQTAFDFRGRDTGKRATEAKGSAVLEIWAKGVDAPLWRGHLTAMSGRSFSEEITDAAVRKSMLEHLTMQLSGMDIPYFIPQAKDVLALPAVVE